MNIVNPNQINVLLKADASFYCIDPDRTSTSRASDIQLRSHKEHGFWELRNLSSHLKVFMPNERLSFPGVHAMHESSEPSR